MWDMPGQGQVALNSIQMGLGGLFLLSHNPKRILRADQMHILVSFIIIIIILLLPSVSEIHQ